MRSLEMHETPVSQKANSGRCSFLSQRGSKMYAQHISFEEFDQTFDEMCDALKRANPKGTGSGSAGTSYRNSDCVDNEMMSRHSWYGGMRSTDEVSDKVLRGWREGGQKANDMATELQRDVETEQIEVKYARRKRRRGSDGDELLVERYNDKLFDSCWESRKRVAGRSPVVTITVAIGGTCAVGADELVWAPVAAIALASILEANGYSTQIKAVSCVRFTDDVFVQTVDVKRADEALRPDAIAAVIAHAGVYRTWMFAARSVYRSPAGMGSTMDPSSMHFDKAEYEIDGDTVIDVPHIYDRKKACDFVKAQLTEHFAD